MFMNKQRIGLIHTSATLVPVFEQLCKKHIAAAVFNLVDDSLIKDVIAENRLTPSVAGRVSRHVATAIEAGADYIMVTCSSIGPAVDGAAKSASVPVLRVDRPLAERAVQLGRRIGIIATLPTTLEPTAELVRRCAAEANQKIILTTQLCEGAFAALMAGDAERHDAMVREALEEVAQHVDVIALAQASMARVASTLPAGASRPPILASPELGVQRLAQWLRNSPRGMR